MNVNLWHGPYNGGWVWWSKRNLRRFSGGWIVEDRKLWWAVIGFSGLIILQTWPWQKNPFRPFPIEKDSEQ